MKKAELKQWLTEGTRQVTDILLAETGTLAGKKQATTDASARRDQLAQLISVAGEPAHAAELLCPVLDGIRNVLFAGADPKDKQVSKAASNKLVAAQRLVTRSIKAAFPDARRVWTPRRKQGDKTHSPAMVNTTTAAARQFRALCKRFPAVAPQTVARMWRDMYAHQAAASRRNNEHQREAQEQAREAQRLALADVINGFDATVQDMAQARKINTATAASLLHDFGKVETGVYGMWLERQAVNT